jgi:hypothetical protein
MLARPARERKNIRRATAKAGAALAHTLPKAVLERAWPFFPIEVNFANEPVLLHNDRAIVSQKIA